MRNFQEGQVYLNDISSQFILFNFPDIVVIKWTNNDT